MVPLAAFGDTGAPIYVFALDSNANQARDGCGLGSYYGWPVYGRTWAWEGNFIENPSMVYDPRSGAVYASFAAGTEGVQSRGGTVASVSFGNNEPTLGAP